MSKTKQIYLAGGCFWGLEAYMKNVAGVVATEVGYANGETSDPTYEDVCAGSGHAEVCMVTYDTRVSGLRFVLRRFFDVIDPTALNKQGGDTGVQYRTGIYFDDPADLPVISDALAGLAAQYDRPLFTEACRLENYTRAEEYHQDYLVKNPGGYCHISLGDSK